MKFVGTFKTIEIDIPGTENAINNLLEVAVREGGRIWLTATTGRVPLWSGMARASLLSLSELVNGRVVLSPLVAKSRIPLGRALGTARVVTQFPNYFFEVSTQVEHYQLQDVRALRRGSRSAPWRSFEAGLKAFEEFAATVELPAVQFIEREIRIG